MRAIDHGGVRHVSVEERRVRLGVRHHLAPSCRAADVVTVAGDPCGLHATGPIIVYLAAWARVAGFEPAQLEGAQYDDHTVLRARYAPQGLRRAGRSGAGR
jgi:hypothetical protein